MTMRSLEETLNLETATQLVSDLVKIYSPYFREDGAMTFAHDWLKERGLEPSYHHYHEKKVTRYKGTNVVGRLKGEHEGPIILLNGHLDTVEICEGWTKDPLGAQVEDGKLYGVGSLDMKAGCAAIMLAVEAFVNTTPHFNGQVLYTLVSDEEGPYGLGTDALILDGVIDYVDAAIVTEPSGSFADIPFPCLCLGARGGWNYTVTVHGKSSHAAHPQLGIDAVEQAARIMLELKAMETITDPTLGKGSIAVIDFQGGGAACSVPDKASFAVFRHTVQGETLGTLRQEVEEAVRRAGFQGPWHMAFREAPHPENGGYHPYTVSQSNPYTKVMMESIRQVTGQEAAISYFPSIGDFNYLASRAKIPTYVFGPQGGDFHGADEYVELSTVVDTARVIVAYLREVLT